MPAPSVRRGFTDHEMLPEFAGGLIHMNGRIYDPNLGRFMTADSVIPDPDDSQSYNRYSYVFNNPLTMTDPDGHCPVCIVILAVAGGVAVSMTTTVVAAIAVGAVFGAMAAGVASEGDPRAMLQGAVIGGIMAGIGFQMKEAAIGGAGASGSESAVGESYLNMYAQAGQSTVSDVAQLETVEVIGRRTLWDRFVGGVINNSHGTASSAGSIANSLYYAAVPGAATMNSAVNYWRAGRYGWAALYGTASFGEAAASILTFGHSQTLMAGMRGAQSTSRGLNHLARGQASEARVLKDMGLTKNTQKVSTVEGNSIPDALTDSLSVEIKDAARVSATRQLRIQTEAAKAAGRQSVLVTGKNTCVSGVRKHLIE